MPVNGHGGYSMNVKYMITTCKEASELIKELKICTIFENSKMALPSLWEYVDLLDKQEGEKGWGQKVTAVWDWKNRLPAEFPSEIFYGKIKGGVAVLMTIEYLSDVHFVSAYRNVETLNSLSQFICEMIRNEPFDTTTLRHEVMDEFGCTKSQFDTALKNLQISLNIVRSNDPGIERDTWLAFREQYSEIWDTHVPEE
ncbi:MAG: hypothetical protein OCD02_17655 [Spirochaetaceae bacterium]